MSRADELYSRVHESGEKFDYFICAATGAMFGYIAQTYTPEKITSAFSALAPTALLFLAASFFCGMLRIQHANCICHNRLTMATFTLNARLLIVLHGWNRNSSTIHP